MRTFLLLCLSAVAVPGCATSPLGCSASTSPPVETRSAPPRPHEVASPVPANGYRTISPAEANKRLATEAGIVLLDVRTQGEHEAKSIPGSVLLPIEPVNMVGPNIGTLVPDKTTPIFIYCRSGRRSVDAAKILVKAGYVRVFDLGGINSWPYETVGADVRR